jgi:hypothetical protein
MKSLLVVVVLMIVASCAAPLAAQTTDISGEWVFDVSTDQGSGSPTFTLKQDGEKLTGTYKGLFGEAALNGSVTGKALKFSFTANAQGNELVITYDGEIESNDSLKGTVDFGGMGTGTFTGKRKK